LGRDIGREIKKGRGVSLCLLWMCKRWMFIGGTMWGIDDE
jgi:hypothetical protein